MTIPLPPPRRTERVVGNIVEITDVSYAYRPLDVETPQNPPQRDETVIHRETWKDTRLYSATEDVPDPDAFVWTRANSIGDRQGLPNSDEVGSDIVEWEGRQCLKLWIRPTATPKSYGARLVFTVGKRWTALQPYAGKRLRFRYDVLFPTLPDIHPTAGTWATVGSQLKDLPDDPAIAQTNMNRAYEPWLGSRSNKPANLTALPYQAGKWHTHDLEALMRSDDSGRALLEVDGQVVGSTTGPQAQAAGYSTWHLCLYSDWMNGPAELLIGDVVISVLEG